MAKLKSTYRKFFAAGKPGADDVRIACYADLHGKLPEPPAGLAAIMVAGDALNYGRAGFPKEEDADFSMWARTRSVLAVRGNHDCVPHCLFGTEDVSGRCVKIVPGISAVGIGWAGRDFFDLPAEDDMEAACSAVLGSMGRRSFASTKKPDKLILLTHYPPLLDSVLKFNGNPAGWAFKCVASLVDQIRPIAVVTGHVHELAGKVAEYEGPGFKSLVVFPGPQGGILSVNKSGDARFEAFPVVASSFERPSGLEFGIVG